MPKNVLTDELSLPKKAKSERSSSSSMDIMTKWVHQVTAPGQEKNFGMGASCRPLFSFLSITITLAFCFRCIGGLLGAGLLVVWLYEIFFGDNGKTDLEEWFDKIIKHSASIFIITLVAGIFWYIFGQSEWFTVGWTLFGVAISIYCIGIALVFPMGSDGQTEKMINIRRCLLVAISSFGTLIAAIFFHFHGYI